MANTRRVRAAGIACAVGGALWVIVLGAAFVVPDAIYNNATGFRIWEALLIVVQALLIAGVVGLAWSGAAASGWLGKIGLGIALLGRVAFLIGEIASFATGVEDEIFIPIGSLLTSAGMILVGIAVLRARRWVGWRRFSPLLAGLYFFVALLPFLVIAGEPPILAIALWGIPWLPLGLALRAEAATATASRAATAAGAVA